MPARRGVPKLPDFLAGGKTLIVCAPKQTASPATQSSAPKESADPMRPAIDALEAWLLEQSAEVLAQH